MKLNKFLILFAGIALMFTACQKDVEREPSPAFPEEVAAIFFPSPDERGAEVDPSAGIYSSVVTIARRDSVGELTVALKVIENTDSIFVVPASVTFADQQKEVEFEISFVGAQDGVSYSLVIEADASQVNPYLEGSAFYQYSVTPIKWIPAEKPAIFDGWVFAAFYGIPEAFWYVPFEYAELGGGAMRYRFKNAYASAPTAVDEWGIYNGFPFNDPGDWDDTQDWFTIINVDSKGAAEISSHQIGVDWTYGNIEIGMTCNFTGDFDTYGFGEFEDGVITFAAGDVFMTMPAVGTRATADEHHIWINPDVLIDAIKEANSQVRLSDFEDGFNDPGIEWVEVEGAYERFETKAFNDKGNAWVQQFFNAVDPNVENPEIGAASDFYNLYMLPDLYAEGFGFAFYYDSVKATVKVPNAEQPTGIKLAGKELSVVPTPDKESFTEIVNIKGTDVTLFHFFLDIVTSDGITFGSYEELFYFSEDPIIFTVDEFEGTFSATGKSLFQGLPPLEQEVTISAVEGVENTLVIKGLDYASEIIATLEPATGVLSVAPQALPDFVEEWEEEDEETGELVPMSGTFAGTLITYTEGGVSASDPILFVKNDAGELVIASSSVAIGYIVSGVNYDDPTDADYFIGFYGVKFSPVSEPAAAPARKPVRARGAMVNNVDFKTGKQISTKHLRAQGKRSHHAPLIKNGTNL